MSRRLEGSPTAAHPLVSGSSAPSTTQHIKPQVRWPAVFQLGGRGGRRSTGARHGPVPLGDPHPDTRQRRLPGLGPASPPAVDFAGWPHQVMDVAVTSGWQHNSYRVRKPRLHTAGARPGVNNRGETKLLFELEECLVEQPVLMTARRFGEAQRVVEDRPVAGSTQLISTTHSVSIALGIGRVGSGSASSSSILRGPHAFRATMLPILVSVTTLGRTVWRTVVAWPPPDGRSPGPRGRRRARRSPAAG